MLVKKRQQILSRLYLGASFADSQMAFKNISVALMTFCLFRDTSSPLPTFDESNSNVLSSGGFSASLVKTG